MRCLCIFLLSVFLTSVAYSQKEGDKWVIGYSGNGSHEYSVMHLDFSAGYLKIEWHFDETMQMIETAANVCDTDGDVIMWTNGMQIFGRNGVSITDTISFDTLYPSYWHYWNIKKFGPLGFPEHDGALILPVPDNNKEYSVISHSAELYEESYFLVNKYLESRIQMNEDSSYNVIYKDSIITPFPAWYSGPIIATRHANGRDWWIVNFEANSSRYYSYILNPQGIHLYKAGNIDSLVKNGLGQTVFSNDGNYIARMDAITFDEGQYITLCSFDRCNGNIERIETLHTPAGYFTGVAFSPNDRYLYGDYATHLWQWDIWADDIAASQTLVDTFDGFIQPGWFEVQFGPMKIAPDGRIYIAPPSGSSEFMHVIDRPDLPAAECKLLQHSINLKVPNARTIPNNPNYRLGPLDGSMCDTLEINNLPVARWRYELDEPEIWNMIRFTDLSFFNPEAWHWDFDDGSTSNDQSPLHSFENGLYHVCLTVSNQNAFDSTCQWVNIINTSIEDDEKENIQDLYIAPNPFNEKIVIQSKSGIFRMAHIILYDIHGRKVFDQPLCPVPVSIFLPSLSPGIYFCTTKDADGKLYSFRIMKI